MEMRFAATTVVAHDATVLGYASGVWTVRLAAPTAGFQGTGMSIVSRDRTAALTPKASALLPISDVDVFDIPGIRSWSPPV